MARSRYREELEGAKERSVGQMLLRAARLWNEEAVRRIQEKSPAIRVAHTAILPHLDLEGTKLTDLAARMGISKQAVGELVDGLEAQGLLERVPDPRDKRAKLIRLTRAGRKSMLGGLHVLGQMEQELARAVGERRMKSLGESLARLVDALEQVRLELPSVDPISRRRE